MAESKRPFNLAEDPGYHRVMKTGRPAHYIPSRKTISRDMTKVFKHSRERIAKLLKVVVSSFDTVKTFRDLPFYRSTMDGSVSPLMHGLRPIIEH
jgi:flagellar biosynthesis/type III secretory pathway ATPase